jgi:hypothetical protein
MMANVPQPEAGRAPLGLPTAMTKVELRALTMSHTRRYTRMVRDGEAGASGIRLDECRLLLKTWSRIALAAGTLDRTYYSEREVQEIRDAYFDEYGEEADHGEDQQP